jgi:hypothetical protein
MHSTRIAYVGLRVVGMEVTSMQWMALAKADVDIYAWPPSHSTLVCKPLTFDATMQTWSDCVHELTSLRQLGGWIRIAIWRVSYKERGEVGANPKF